MTTKAKPRTLRAIEFPNTFRRTWARSPTPFTFRWFAANGKAIFSSLFLLSTLFAFNGIQVLSLLLLPFSPTAFRRVNRWAANSWWGLCVVWIERAYKVRAAYSGDSLPMRENALVIANHQQMPDILVLLTLARRHGRLGDLKWFLKDVLKYAPGIGWGLLFLDNLFVKRNWDSDQRMIESTFSKYNRHRIPMWLVSFIEGTRLTPQKLARSQEFARQQGLPVPQYVLIPKTKGFVASVRGLRSHVAAIYDVTIYYPEGIPTLWQFFQGMCGEFQVHVRRYPISALPEIDDELSSWARERFREKDRLLAQLHSPAP